MEREILFRARRKDNGKWIEGLTLFKPDEHLYMFQTVWGEITYDLHYNITAILGGKTPFFVEVIPETVGRFTGLTDRNGVKIFEGDVVEHTTFLTKKIRTGYVEYSEGCGAFFIMGSGHSDNQMYAFCNFKVIGNVHDNPELMEGKIE